MLMILLQCQPAFSFLSDLVRFLIASIFLHNDYNYFRNKNNDDDNDDDDDEEEEGEEEEGEDGAEG